MGAGCSAQNTAGKLSAAEEEEQRKKMAQRGKRRSSIR
jgi:hypothetical protein